ncbi:conserved domain protein [Streptococcus constellatus subsp. pharyngis SK1060 = CCUG 46377]|uniref:Conserved domain protein n=1 Tax=Streptococcus constellatus subsp. pharyngis SK1060 = CCUG 46377 TaxID=1035184 RepID=F9P5X9_STRCV|nr:conserved domain protein [Streptococcus constellatus subsp. pharyngis SK1060 = CCUG 46377]
MQKKKVYAKFITAFIFWILIFFLQGHLYLKDYQVSIFLI